MRAAIIHNPSAGVNANHSLLDGALQVLREFGWQVALYETRAAGQAVALARQAADSGLEAAFAVGGDGTLNEVLNGVLGSETAIGILPFGTANVWALEMGLPLNDLPRAARLQAQAAPRAIDVGVAQGKTFGPRAFILSCGAGFDAAVIHEVETQRALKRRWGKLYFVLVGLRQAVAYRGRRIRVTIDGDRMARRVILALTSNTQLYGAFARIPPDARIDDGLLDVTLLHGKNVFSTAWLFLRLGAGLYKLQPDIEQRRGRVIELAGAPLPIHLDAEPVGSTPAQIHIQPRALRVLVPSTAHRELFQDTRGANTDAHS